MKRMAAVMLATGLLGVAMDANAQSSIASRRIDRVAKRAIRTASDQFREKKEVTEMFGAGALGFFPAREGGFDVSTEALKLQVFGIPRQRPDGDTIIYEETIAFEFYVDSYVVDALVANGQAIKEYLISKKGSPLSARFPLPKTYWSTRKGTVRQFWMGGQAYTSARAIPLGDTGFERLAGAVNGGYTQTINIDFATQDKPGNVFGEATFNAALPFGRGVRDQLFGDSVNTRHTLGLDYRVGITLGGTKALTVVGTHSFTDVVGKRSTIRFTFSGSD